FRVGGFVYRVARCVYRVAAFVNRVALFVYRVGDGCLSKAADLNGLGAFCTVYQYAFGPIPYFSKLLNYFCLICVSISAFRHK
ncbi:MAG: hypothetical protein ABF683_13540, partial [Sporolactobacillus sp.]